MKLNQTNLSGMADEELLAVILEKSVARELMAEYGSVQQMLWQASKQELETIKGIGVAKARKIQCIAEIAKRVYRMNNALPPVIKTPGDAFKRMEDMQFLAVEQFRVIYLNTKNGIIAEEVVAQGTINSTIVGGRELFRRAVRLLAASIILIHNHPSGDAQPSQEDIVITRKLVEAGKLLDIAILDHIIIGRGKFESLKEKGIL
ncbi:DNA repair protein RadC [Pelosinus propionicus DSM 13327]|uniref:DNA repair protein RadC n=2 Tax=Pelosinus TaxID=365348 RepID=A0A1I4Q9L4_9FIRM|nr:DNA repair protein RadC [Pelosinus propionicus DSM 13327]